jgi:membrane dipeptidase
MPVGIVRSMLTIRFALVALLACLTAGAPLAAQVPDSALIRRALRLHQQVPMIDGHNDLPWEIRSNFAASLDSADLGRGVPTLHTDIARLRQGGVGAQFWSIWAPTDLGQRLGPQLVLEQIDIVRRIEQRWPGVFAPARTADDIVRAHRAGRIASLIGIEGGDYMWSSLGVLRQFFELGARYMTLTWNATLPWADAAADSARNRGLSPFGREVVREMNRLGMLVDISHVSDAVMSQVLRESAAPAIFSHSSARALGEHVRNVPDSILQLLPRNGGIVMVNFYCSFVDSARIRWNRARAAAQSDARARSGGDTARVRAGMEQWVAANPQPAPPPLGVMADHIEHIRNVAGVDHVGYGSDYDGIDCAPAGLEDVSTFPRLTAELLRRGWSDNDVKKVIGSNMLRVMRRSEEVARRLQRERGPSPATIAQLDSAVVGR